MFSPRLRHRLVFQAITTLVLFAIACFAESPNPHAKVLSQPVCSFQQGPARVIQSVLSLRFTTAIQAEITDPANPARPEGGFSRSN